MSLPIQAARSTLRASHPTAAGMDFSLFFSHINLEEVHTKQHPTIKSVHFYVNLLQVLRPKAKTNIDQWTLSKVLPHGKIRISCQQKATIRTLSDGEKLPQPLAWHGLKVFLSLLMCAVCPIQNKFTDLTPWNGPKCVTGLAPLLHPPWPHSPGPSTWPRPSPAHPR